MNCVARFCLILLGLTLRDVVRAAAIDADAFGKFADEQIDAGVSHNEYPGAVVLLVENGTIALARGYGVTDVNSRKPVDALTTGFRVGSVSKLITATAVLQLAERGKIGLGDEIQPHLPDLPLGDAGAGVTIHHLLTHTDGFDVGWPIGGAARDPREAMTLQQFLQSHRPRRILPPGQMYVYSDVGMAVAGHIVENVDGRPFAKYVQEEVFSPLGMNRSTFEQTLPEEIRENLATGYRKFGGVFRETPIAQVGAISSAGMTTTAGDMARFIIACLDGGEIHGGRVLSPASMALMRTRQFSHHPALPGAAYGFHEHVHNGQIAFMHSGVMPGYHAIVILLPRENTGLFVATNGYGDQTFEPFVNALFDRFYPKSTSETPAIAATSITPPTDLSGRYRYVQYPHNNLGKLCILAGLVEEMRVKQMDNGQLIVDQGIKGPWTCTAPLLYVRGEEKLAFRVDDRGKTVGAVYDTWAFEKIRFFEGQRAQTALIIALAATFLIMPIIRLITRWRRRDAIPSPSRDCTAIACAMNLLFLIGLIYSVWRADIFEWYYGLPRLVVALRYVPWISIVVTLIAIVLMVREISASGWRLTRRWSCHAATLWALIVFPVFCWYWNLLAWPD